MKLFVYGSLLRGLYNNYILKHDKFIRESTIFGNYVMYTHEGDYPRLADLSVVNAFHPLLHPNKIIGEVWEISEETFVKIDLMESRFGYYRYVLKDETGDDVNVYFIKQVYSETAVIIQNGDWREYQRLQHVPKQELSSLLQP